MGEDTKEIVVQEAGKEVNATTIKNLIYVIRGQQVMLDSDLAMLYQVETKVFNQAVKRNEERFPKEFCFQLTRDEYNALRSQFVTSKGKGGRRYLPYVFTEQGIAMLSAVLRSDVAIQVSIKIMNTFVEMRRFDEENKLFSIAGKFAEPEIWYRHIKENFFEARGYELEGEMRIIGESSPCFEEVFKKSEEKYLQWKRRHFELQVQ